MIGERTASTHFLRRLRFFFFFLPLLFTAGPGKGWAAEQGFGGCTQPKPGAHGSGFSPPPSSPKKANTTTDEEKKVAVTSPA